MLLGVDSLTAEDAKFSHGGLDEEEADNANRCGDPHPQAGRLLQESEECRHALTGPPSEEVTFQTAPSRPRGGCTVTKCYRRPILQEGHLRGLNPSQCLPRGRLLQLGQR